MLSNLEDKAVVEVNGEEVVRSEVTHYFDSEEPGDPSTINQIVSFVVPTLVEKQEEDPKKQGLRDSVIEGLEERITLLETSLAARNTEIRDLNNTISDLNDTLTEQQCKIEEQEKSIENQKKALINAGEEFASQKKELQDELAATKKALEDEMASYSVTPVSTDSKPKSRRKKRL